jgi:putative adhesin
VRRRLPITTGRLLALLVGVPSCLCVIGLVALGCIAGAGKGKYQVHMSLPARGRAVHVSISGGTLNVSAASDDRLLLTGTASYSVIRSTVTGRVTSTRASAVSRCHFVFSDCSFSLDVGLPAGAPAYFTTGAGDITVTGLTSKQVTASGNEGDITLTFVAIPDHVRVSDQFGNVTLVLPPGPTAYRVSADASLGHSSVRVPTSPSSPHVINVSDATGDIVIRARSAA